MTNPSNGQTQAAESTALTPIQARSIELREGISTEATPRAIVPRTFAEAQAFAAALAHSSLVPEALRERAPDILMIVLAGAELEIPPIRALSLFHVIEGVPKLSADGIAARCMASPTCEYLEFVEESPTQVTWVAKRVGRPEKRITYTLAMAQAAGLVRPTRSGAPGQWQKFPVEMMHARCKKKLGNLVWPDICAGLQSAEEALDEYEQSGGPRRGKDFAEVAPAPAPAPLPTTTPATTQAAPAPAPSKAKQKTADKAKPIDVTATEQPASTSTAGSTTSPTTTDTGSASPTASSSAPSATASSTPAPADTVQDVSASTTVAASQPSAPVEDESGFGDDEPPTPANVRSIEEFERQVAALVSARNTTGFDALKADWLAWSKDETPTGGKRHAQRMRQVFAKAKTDLGIK